MNKYVSRPQLYIPEKKKCFIEYLFKNVVGSQKYYVRFLKNYIIVIKEEKYVVVCSR